MLEYYSAKKGTKSVVCDSMMDHPQGNYAMEIRQRKENTI